MLYYFKGWVTQGTKNHDTFSKCLIEFKENNFDAVSWWTDYFWNAYANLFYKNKPETNNLNFLTEEFYEEEFFHIRPPGSKESEKTGYSTQSSLDILINEIVIMGFKTPDTSYLESFFHKDIQIKSLRYCGSAENRLKELIRSGFRINPLYFSMLEEFKEDQVEPVFVIIDDVYTTGTTTNLMAELIQEVCPSKIIVLTLTRNLRCTNSNVGLNNKIAGYK